MGIRRKRTFAGAVVLTAFLFWVPFQAFPAVQDSKDSAPVDRLNKTYFKKFGQDFGSVIASPGRWGTSDFLKFTALAGTGVLLYGFDQKIYDWVQKQKTPSSINASPYISKFGQGGYLTALAVAMYASGEIFDSPGLRKTALLSLESFLTTTAVVLTLKAVAGRARPNTGESARSFTPFSFTSGYTSFPSGDAAGAFSVATVIAEQTPEVFVDILAYGLAGLVAIYRVHDRKHWPSDVFTGSALGFFVGKKISRLNKNSSSGNYHVSFEFTPHQQSITLSLYF